MISRNVMRLNEFKESIYYRVACDCGTSEDDVTIEFEIEEHDRGVIYLNFYKNVLWSTHYGNYNFIRRFWRRLTCSLKMFFTGHIELEESFILRDTSNIDGFIEALIEGKERIKNKVG